MEEPSSHASHQSSRGLLPRVRVWTPVTLLLVAAVVRASSKYDFGSRDNLRSASPNLARVLQDVETVDSEQCSLDCCLSYESEICPSDNEWISALPFAIQIILIIILLSLSALFSGLTLGLMSLDKTGLEIVIAGDDVRNAAYAKKIYPVRENGNLLLCTLLLGNVAVNALLSILLAVYAGGTLGFVTSTFLIVIFGEIVPQAFCSRYALRVGSATVPVVKVIRFLIYPIAKPLAWCLDKALGRELASTYSSAEILKLLQIHVQENIIDQETAGAMTGALTYKNFAVKDVMTPLERVFMLNVDEKLSFETIARIFKTGYSRIPVYEVSSDNVIGLLFVKDLIFVDPEDDTPLRSFIQIFGRGVHLVWPDDSLGDVLAELKKGRSHLALVRDVNNDDETQDPFYEIKGIITLEDIIEKILGDTIVDETDAFVDSTQSKKVNREESFEWARLRLLDSKIVDEMLSFEEVKAVTAHLRMNHADTVKLLSDSQLERLVSETPVTTLAKATRKVGKDLPEDLLYQKGVQTDVCTLVLSGKVTIFVGSDNFRSDVSSWSLLGTSALGNASYVPDFTAYISDGPCRCLRLSYARFADAVDATALEKRLNHESKLATAEYSAVSTPEAEIRSETTRASAQSDGANAGESINRRGKMMAALHMFKKGGSSAALECTQNSPENGAPAASRVRFQDGRAKKQTHDGLGLIESSTDADQGSTDRVADDVEDSGSVKSA